MKLSIVIPVYFNELNLKPLYKDIKKKVLDVIDYDYEIIFVDDGSGDNSYQVLEELAKKDRKIKLYRLSRNFGEHAAVMCGLEQCTGDCAVTKAADLQEPTEMILEMVKSWKQGNNVVLAVRKDREESKKQVFFANLYYWLVQKTAFKNMPKTGFDVFLLDRKVIDVITKTNESNSALPCQVLWAGFKTSQVEYTRKAREIGTSKWTLAKKIRYVTNTLFSFSTLPIRVVELIGFISFVGSIIWTIIELVLYFNGSTQVVGWTSLFIFNLFSFGIIMITLGILGEYMWRTFDASRNRPAYIIEKSNTNKKQNRRLNK